MFSKNDRLSVDFTANVKSLGAFTSRVIWYASKLDNEHTNSSSLPWKWGERG